MALPYSKLRSKLNRAIAAYLVNTGTCGSDTDISESNVRQSKGYPNTTVRATMSRPDVQMTGLRRITVHISVKGSAVQIPGDPNDESARIQFDDRVSNTMDALMQTSDGQTLHATALAITAAGRALVVPVDNTPGAIQEAANNADMMDFTCQAWYDAGEGDGEPDETGTSWEEILIFEALCSPSNVD